MAVVRQVFRAIKNWAPKVFQGILFLPEYMAYKGPVRAGMRITWLLIKHGLYGIRYEFWSTQGIRNFARPDRLDYIIFAPDFVPNSAGIFSLYKLCHDLNERGFKSAMTGAIRTSKDLNAPMISGAMAKKLAKAGAFTIYPEIVKGNPIGGPNVIRWVLNRPGLLGGDEVYSDSEFVFVYSSIYSPFVKNKISGKLYMPTLDRRIFHPPERETERSLQCFYVGKSKFKEGHFDRDSVLEITRDYPRKKDLGPLFRLSKVLYTFDNSTALIHEAIACGCVVVVIPDGTQTWENYEKLELGRHGILWGKWDSNFLLDPAILAERIESLERDYQKQLDHLIKVTQEMLNLKTANTSVSLAPKAIDSNL